MTPTKLAKQMLDFQKTSFDNGFNAVILLQEQTEKMASSALNQTPWFPAEGPKALNKWESAFKKGCEDFKKAVDESFEKMETLSPSELAKQMLDFQKTSFDNGFNAVILLQEQTKKMASSVMDQTPWFPAEEPKALNKWESAFKKGREDFKKAVDESFEKMATYLSEPVKAPKAQISEPPAKQMS